MPTIIIQERKKLENIKKQQEENLKILINYEFNIEEQRKIFDAKIKAQKEKEEQMRLEKLKKDEIRIKKELKKIKEKIK